MRIYAIGYKPGCHSHRPPRIGVARRDQQSALSQLVLHNQTVVYNLAYRILGDPELAATATEDTFRRAFPAPPRYHGKSPRLGLMRIAVAVCQEQLCQAPILNSDSCESLVGDNAMESVTAHIARQPSCDGFQAFLNALLPDQRVTLVLSDAEGLGYREIAEITGVSTGVIRSRLSQGRAALRDALLDQGELSPGVQPRLV